MVFTIVSHQSVKGQPKIGRLVWDTMFNSITVNRGVENLTSHSQKSGDCAFLAFISNSKLCFVHSAHFTYYDFWFFHAQPVPYEKCLLLSFFQYLSTFCDVRSLDR